MTYESGKKNDRNNLVEGARKSSGREQKRTEHEVGKNQQSGKNAFSEVEKKEKNSVNT
jgi:hypothetical protein